MEERHAHEVMEMMMAAGKAYSRASLVEDIQASFGHETRFYSCSASGMSPEELIDFLESRGKLSGPPDAFRFDPAGRCNH